MARTVHKGIVLLVCGLMLGIPLSLGHAQTNSATGASPTPTAVPANPATGACIARDIETVYTPLDGGTFDIKVRKSRVTVLKFPETFDFDFAGYGNNGIRVLPHTNILTVTLVDAKPGMQTTVTVGDKSYIAHLNVTASETESTGVLRVVPLPPDELARQRERMAASEEVEACTAEVAGVTRRAIARFLLRFKDLDTVAGRIAMARPEYSNPGRLAPPGEIHAALGWAVQVADHHYGLVIIDNQSGQTVDIIDAAISDRSNHKGMATEIEWEESAHLDGGMLTIDHKESVRGRPSKF